MTSGTGTNDTYHRYLKQKGSKLPEVDIEKYMFAAKIQIKKMVMAHIEDEKCEDWSTTIPTIGSKIIPRNVFFSSK